MSLYAKNSIIGLDADIFKKPYKHYKSENNEKFS